MSRSEFNHLLSSIGTLSPAQMQRLLRALESTMEPKASKRSGQAKVSSRRRGRKDTAYDLANHAGLIGCIKGAPRSPTDLSTNRKHMEGFGRD